MEDSRVKILYLLESTGLWGGVKNVFDQARALEMEGHDVGIRTKQGDHSWYPYSLQVDYVGDLDKALNPGEKRPDAVVATFWTTVLPALRLGCPKTFHLCQGYEGDFLEYADMRRDIEDAYRSSIAKITNGVWLNRILEERFGKGRFKMHVIPPIVDTAIFKPGSSASQDAESRGSRRQRVLIVGLFGISGKAIADALRATEIMRSKNSDIQTVRVSPVDTSDKEKSLFRIDEYHAGLTPGEMVQLYRTADIFLSSSHSQEGFGLPFAEALACGVPSVVTDILPYKSHDAVKDYALFVPQRDPEAMADAALEIIRDENLRKKLRQRGPEVIRRKYRSDLIAKKLEKVFLEG